MRLLAALLVWLLAILGAGGGDERLPRDRGGVAALLPGVECLSAVRPRRFPSGMRAAQHALGIRNDVVADRALREEAFNHFVFSDVKHVMLVCREYRDCYNGGRPSQALHAIPEPYPELQAPPRTHGNLVALPVLGGVQHDYRLAA
jgi:hypothetical protein